MTIIINLIVCAAVFFVGYLCGEGTAPSSHLDELLDLAPRGTTADQLASWGRSMIGGDTSHMLQRIEDLEDKVHDD